MWVDKHGPGWRIRDRIAGRVLTIQGGYATKTAARSALVTLQADRLRGDELVPRGHRVTVASFVEQWWPAYARSLKGTTRDSEGARLRNHILPTFGPLELGEVDTLAIQRWVGDLSDGSAASPPSLRRRPLSPKSVHNAHGLLHTLLDAAVAAKLVRSNPCGTRYLPAREHVEMRFLTDPEMARLVAALPEHWRPLVVLMLATGLRWGEAIGLRAGRVDVLAKRPRLLVVEQLQERGGSGSDLYFTSPKTARSRRTVSFTRGVALVLAPLVAGRAPDEVVFTTVTGAMIRTRNFRRIWLTALRRAGLEGLRVHDLRHTHAAVLLSEGISITKLSRRLGHASVAVTDQVYGHLRQDSDDDVLAAVDASLVGIAWEQGGSTGPETAGSNGDQQAGSSRSAPAPGL